MLSKQLQQQEVLAAGPGSSSKSDGSRFIYTRSNHNSVLGVGAYAAANGAQLVPLTDQEMDDWMTAAAAEQQQEQQQVQQQVEAVQLGRRWQLPWQAKQQDVQLQTAAAVQQTDQQQPLAEQQQQQQQVQPRYHLVAYPAQDNFAGVVYPLDYINKVRRWQLMASMVTIALLAALLLLVSHEQGKVPWFTHLTASTW
jgi:hypothetical protein